MKTIAIIGNPNTGKSTLFNSLTKSNIHTGNWHGVTVTESSKTIKHSGIEYNVVDLPGFYSMTAFTLEEQVSIDYILKNPTAHYIYVVDANSLRRNLYLAIQLLNQGIKLVIYVNNYDLFTKAGGKINADKLASLLGTRVIIGNAIKQKFTTQLIAQENANILPQLTTSEQIYEYIESVYSQSVTISLKYTYGESRLDKILLNKWLFLPLFLLSAFAIMYITFFAIGQTVSDGLIWLVERCIESPLSWALGKVVKAQWLLDLFDNGVCEALNSVLSFVFPVCLLYVFLGLIEDSGIMSRIAFMLDDSLSRVGLNGKSAYTLLLGFGCNTTAIITASGMPNKNAQTKTAILTPFMSCTAKLPIYSVIATQFFGAKSIFVIFGLYLLGIIVALVLAGVLEKTTLPSADNHFLLEFPAVRKPSIKKVCKNALFSAKNFITKVVYIVVCVSVIVWVLTNFNFRFNYLPNGTQNILPSMAKLIEPLFCPLGFASVGVVCSLLAGIVAKELILSSMVIMGAINALTPASALSFLVFCLLYSPCISSVAVLNNFVGKKWTLFTILAQFGTAYVLARVVYVVATWSFGWVDLALTIMTIIFVVIGLKMLKHQKFCLSCHNCSQSNCKRCKK